MRALLHRCRRIRTRVAAGITAMACSTGILLGSALPVQAQNAAGQTVIVIDPGHGGTEMGAEYAPYGEKALTLYVAQLVAAELMLYDNVEVDLTRTGDYDVSIADRVNYAYGKNADFLFSIHFNASGSTIKPHGSMILISAFGDLYAQEAAFGLLNLQQLEAVGLTNRGFLTRLGSSGKDYYGIVRRAADYGMQAVITEHCYLDNDTDRAWLSQEDSYARLAHADATALAQYLHLRSTALGVDYSNYPIPSIEVPASSTTPVMMAPVDSALYYGY